MSIQARDRGDTRPSPSSPRALVETRIEPGDVAASLDTDAFYFVVDRPERPAGEYVFSGLDTTLASWYGVDEDAGVLEVVELADLEAKPDRFGGVDDVLAAIASGRVLRRAVPEPWVVVALEEFLAERAAGTWEGVVEYVRRGR
jgi:hypothetical protein